MVVLNSPCYHDSYSAVKLKLGVGEGEGEGEGEGGIGHFKKSHNSLLCTSSTLMGYNYSSLLC